VADLQVTAGLLPAVSADLRREVDEIARAVDEADGLVDALRAAWTGAASGDFMAAWASWCDAAAALRADLAEVRRVLDATEANYGFAQRAVLHAWAGTRDGSAPGAVVGMSAGPGGATPPWVTLFTPEIAQAARVSTSAQDAVVQAIGRSGLEAAPGFAGDDAALGAFRVRYDAIARRTWDALEATVAVFGGVAVGLTDTANAWLEADETLVPGGVPREGLPAPSVIPRLSGAGPAPAAGPGMIGPVPDVVAEYWPDVEPSTVELVSDAWRAVGNAMARADVQADEALRTVRATNAGPVFDAVDRYWREVHGPGTGALLDVASRSPGILATTTGRLAEIVRETQREFCDALAHHPVGDDQEETYYLLQAAKYGASFMGAVGRVGTRLVDAAETGLRINLARGRYVDRVAQLVVELDGVTEADLERSTGRATTVEDVAASFVGTPQGPGGTIVPLTVDRRQIERKYRKHAEDFGVDVPRGAAGFEEVTSRIHELMEAPATRHVRILYRGERAIANYDPVTRLCVIQRDDGSFLSGWRLSPDQYSYVTTKRYLR
jgi:WXG100 family type VII secretion target